MSKQYDKEFKESAVKFFYDNTELSMKKAAANLGIAPSTLSEWIKVAFLNQGEVPSRSSGNYLSREAKEIARLRKELCDTKDSLLKRKPSKTQLRKERVAEQVL